MNVAIHSTTHTRSKPWYTLARREALEGYLYILPWVLGFLIFTALPMLVSLYLSLTLYKIISPPKFIGLENYMRLLHRIALLEIPGKHILLCVDFRTA